MDLCCKIVKTFSFTKKRPYPKAKGTLGYYLLDDNKPV